MQVLKRFIKKYWSHFIYQKQLKRQAYISLLDSVNKKNGRTLSNVSGNIFTYHGEDGIIQFILRNLKNVPPLFIDIGSGDCIKSNCAVLAVHQNWNGVFVDANKSQLNVGERFYKKLNKSNLQFVNISVTPNNINDVIRNAGYEGSVGLLSIDIDGNDFWIWNAIEVVSPLIVVIEAKVEFGSKNIVVPYSEKNHRSYDKMYNGASVEAIKKLGHKKGYTLIGAIEFGYNLFFVKDYLVQHPLHAADTYALLQHQETQKSFYQESFFNTHEFIEAD